MNLLAASMPLNKAYISLNSLDAVKFVSFMTMTQRCERLETLIGAAVRIGNPRLGEVVQSSANNVEIQLKLHRKAVLFLFDLYLLGSVSNIG